MKTSIIYPAFFLFVALFLIPGCKKNNPGPKPIIPVLPTVTAISPTSGLAGTAVTITGTHFGATVADNGVKFNGTDATITSASATTLLVTAPAGGSTGAVSVTTSGGTATGPVFTYLLAPTVTAINPTSGLAGASVTITGTNFDAVAANNIVKFHGVATTVTTATTTSLVVKTPAGGSTGAVTVTTSGGTATGPVFTYLLAPTVTAISPTFGVPGASVTITGTNFDAVAANNIVKFHGIVTTVTSATPTSLVVKAPAGGSTGAVTVTTSGGTATGPVFTYLVAPTVTAISPTSGVPGASVTITGTNLDAVAANNIVKFHGMVTTVTSATPTSLVVKAPAGGSTGAVTVTTAGGIATGPVFTYLAAPVIVSINPVSAAVGAAVTITGTNFNAIAANNVVKFNGTTATVTSASTTHITAKVPAGGTNGNITVTTTGGTSNGIAFTYLAAAGPNIYVLGSDTQFGFGYWKNSTFTATTDCSNPYAMQGVGNDIYFAGPSSSQTPTYWKNNTAVHISSQTGYTFCIAVSGTDVYCLGNVGSVYNVWKNGVAMTLTTSSLIYINGYSNNSMAVSNGNVYVAGAQYLGNSTIMKATYWKNGTPVDLTDGIHSGSARATAVFVSGSDVYVAGTEEIRDISTGGIINNAPRLWKNGVSMPIATPANSLYNTITSILVTGGNVYLGGQYNNTAAVWKNGAMINTSTYAVAEMVSSIFLYNNTDLYITGASSSSGNNCYWKNGNFVEMDPGCTTKSASCAGTAANQVVAIYVK